MALPVVAMGITGAISAIQGLIGDGQIKEGNQELKRLFSKREAFQTPQQILDIVNMAQFNASQGYSDETINYITGQAGAGLSSTLGAATKLGADPNNIAALIDGFYQNIFKVGAESELVKMKKFDSLTNALNLLAENKAAEWQSQDNLIKDQMQAAATKVAGGQQNLQSGVNTALSSLSALATNGLYNTKTPSNTVQASTVPATVPASPLRDFSIGNRVGGFYRN